MSYVDAFFDRDQDIIRVVERKDGNRHFHEYQAKYTFYYKDPRGKYKSVYGDPLNRIVCKNTKDFRKEVAINKNKDLFESDINPIFQCLSENYLKLDKITLRMYSIRDEDKNIKIPYEFNGLEYSLQLEVITKNKELII